MCKRAVVCAVVLLVLAGTVNAAIEYNFNEGSGTTAVNSGTLGTAVNGTIVGATYGAGVNGSALYFDGSGDYVIVPHDDGYVCEWGLPWTVEMWVKPTSLSGSKVLVEKWLGGTDSARQFYISLENGKMYMDGRRPDGASLNNYNGITGNTALTLNEWNHIAFTYNTETKNFHFWLNGVEDYVYNFGGTWSTGTTPFDMYIASPRNGAGSFVGAIDNFQIYKGIYEVPEPVTLVMFGLGGLALIRKSR